MCVYNLNFCKTSSDSILHCFYILASNIYTVALVVKPFRSYDIAWNRHENEVTAENVPVVRKTRGCIFSMKRIYSLRERIIVYCILFSPLLPRR